MVTYPNANVEFRASNTHSRAHTDVTCQACQKPKHDLDNQNFPYYFTTHHSPLNHEIERLLTVMDVKKNLISLTPAKMYDQQFKVSLIANLALKQSSR